MCVYVCVCVCVCVLCIMYHVPVPLRSVGSRLGSQQWLEVGQYVVFCIIKWYHIIYRLAASVRGFAFAVVSLTVSESSDLYALYVFVAAVTGQP